MPENEVARRPGGRSAAVLASVKTAVEELIAEKGRERVTIPMIAERAGVQPSSVYRRWGDLPTMINDVATYRLDPARPIPDTGDIRRDLELWAAEIVEHYRNPVNAALLRGGASTAGELESDCLRNRRSEAQLIVDRVGTDAAPTPGTDAALTADTVIDGLLAPIMYRVIFLPWTLDDELVPRLLGMLFR
ncbi:TetR/AcrR family transcriptional regulator [Galbitalea sp. SE-J8]|uniref:TetR/AcrR family transcriptional regulator n=1 Tax=Galbitalea sp. SE-J8 TaxID=3054952 RepID=UPI00259CA879|nr:TetR/AcrR family transcriptional regulator [Galbitalea sp. SE-J8]MDM4763295.1 TetR/AcrR family transcriptional regulator [Galbitalea sp. SE-J8]